MKEIIPFIIGGLVLFIFAIFQLSQALQNVFTENAKEIIEKYTSNIFYSIIIGTLSTILLGSSSAVIIISIVFINAKSLSFKQAIGIIMGANIGTTFSSQIILLDIGKYSIIPLITGIIIMFVSKKENTKKYGRILFYFGMLFFGLYTMEESASPLKDSDVFKEWITRIDNNYIQGTLIGGLITLIIQSSSATVGLAIVLGKKKLITVSGGIAIMLGAELGTCSNTLIATIKGSRQAIKAGLFHLLFNLISISIGLLMFAPFINLISFLTINPEIDNQIAVAHLVFNALGVICFLPFVGFAENLLNYLLPDKKSL